MLAVKISKQTQNTCQQLFGNGRFVWNHIADLLHKYPHLSLSDVKKYVSDLVVKNKFLQNIDKHLLMLLTTSVWLYHIQNNLSDLPHQKKDSSEQSMVFPDLNSLIKVLPQLAVLRQRQTSSILQMLPQLSAIKSNSRMLLLWNQSQPNQLQLASLS